MCNKYNCINCKKIKKMGEFIAPGTYRSTISKLKLKSIEKNKKGILVIALKPGIFYMRFINAYLKKTLKKKNHRHKRYAKMHKISGNFRIEWVKSPL